MNSVLGESRGLVVKAEDSQLSGCWFELDGVSKASCYKLQWKNEIKVAKWGTPKKNIKKMNSVPSMCHVLNFKAPPPLTVTFCVIFNPHSLLFEQVFFEQPLKLLNNYYD